MAQTLNSELTVWQWKFNSTYKHPTSLSENDVNSQ